MGIAILAFLILLNGLFAMSEIAMVSVRRARLEGAAARGDRGAAAALAISRAPTRFLSTIQVGITLIGIFAGAFGEAAISGRLAALLDRFPPIAPFSRELSFTIVVLAITYFSLVIGELVPKRLALSDPERISARIARPMNAFSRVMAPAVHFLTLSTELILRALRIGAGGDRPVTEEDVRGILAQGRQAGVFNEPEHRLVERILNLGNRRVSSLMVPRPSITWINLPEHPPQAIARFVAENPHSHFPVGRGSLDALVGIIHVKDLLRAMAESAEPDLARIARPPLFVPESAPALKVLDTFKKAGAHFAVVLDEYGALVGVVTLNDIVEGIVGEITILGEEGAPQIVRRDDGSWLLDGMLAVDELKELLGSPTLPREDESDFHTVGGFVMTSLGRIPAVGDVVDWDRFSIRVIEMDRQRVGRVLLKSRPPTPPTPPPANP